MIYELRIYRCLPGRLPEVLKRFENPTLQIWERHGIRQVGFWTTMVGENANDLTYLLEWDSLADREKRWSAFLADADWKAERIASEANGPLLESISNSILAPTSFSARR
jgi:hypothetical protein